VTSSFLVQATAIDKIKRTWNMLFIYKLMTGTYC